MGCQLLEMSLNYKVLVLLVSLKLVGCQIKEFHPPILNYKEMYIDVPVETNFTVQCEGRAPLKWKLPEMWRILIEDRTSMTFEYDENVKDNSYRSSLLVYDLQSTDTGLYSCYYENTTDFEDRAKVTSIYLFANDPENLFVDDIKFGSTLFSIVIFGQESVLPCLPTHSDANVTFMRSSIDSHEIIPFSQTVEFNPKRGIVLHYPTNDFGEFFMCQTELNDVYQEVSFYIVFLGDTPSAPDPTIERIGAPHAVVNDSLILRCIVRLDVEARMDINFEYPAQGTPGVEDRIETSQALSDRRPNNFGNKYTYNELTIKRLTLEDEGIYKCLASDHTKKVGSTEMYLKVLNLQPPAFVNLTTDLVRTVEEPLGTESIRFVVKYYTYPADEPVEFVWRKDDQLLNDKRHIPSKAKDSPQHILTIKNLRISDSGNYTLQAKTKDLSQSVTIALIVTEKPKVTIIDPVRYVVSGQNHSLECVTTGWPKPMIWWKWKSCENPFKCDIAFKNFPSREVPPQDLDEEGADAVISAKSLVTIYNGDSGYYKCESDNKLKGIASSDPLLVIVTDAVNGLDIVQSLQDPIVLDNVTITCRANQFEFSDVNWYWTPLGQNGSDEKQPLVFNTLTKFDVKVNNTIESKLIFNPILSENAGTYFCNAVNRSGQQTKEEALKIEIRAMMSPVLNYTNLLDKAIQVDKAKDFKFFCYAYGVPEPVITWYKNDAPFNISSMTGVDLIDNGQKIIINRLVETDSGTYKCKVENRAGSITRSLTITVGSSLQKEPHPGNGALMGMVGGIVLIIILFICVGGILARRMYKDKKLKLDLELEGFKNFEIGRLDMYNPDLPLDDQAELLPYDNRWEFPKERLIIGKTLGQGAFGRVVKAEAIGISDYENSTTVAVKMLKERTDKTQLKALIAELKIMIHLGKHLNVLNMVGAVTKNIARGELMVLVEYCEYGNLRHYLLHQRKNFINQIAEDGEIDVNITTQMSYISKNRKMSVRTTENDLVEKQLHYADIVHAYKRGFSRELSRQASQGDSNTDVSGPKNLQSSVKGRFLRSGSSSSNSFHKSVVGRSISGGGETTSNRSRLDSVSSSIPDEVLSDNSTSKEFLSASGMSYKYKGDLKDTPITTCDVLCFCFQIARGMEYLSSKKLIHRDLAARNILLAEDNVVKICDFGLAKDCYKYSNYVKKGDGPLPIKWMAIESIRDKVFTTQTDVWSYAILLWEIFTLGGNPYPGFEIDEEFFKKLKNGYRMEKPEYSPNSVFKLMEECWEAEPQDRPNFTDVATQMGNLLEGSMKQYYIELNNPFELMNEEMQNNNDYLTMEGKDRDSNYLNMRGSQTSDKMAAVDDQTAHYDNIRSIRPVGVAKGEEIVLKPPMEVVPMIQFGDNCGDVKLTNYSSDAKELPTHAQKLPESSSVLQLTDYIYMGSPKKKEFVDHPFSVGDKSDDSVQYTNNSERPPSYNAVVEGEGDEIFV